jgi:sugar phosphate isomerase/epimerase
MLGTWETGDWNIAHNPAAWEMMFNELSHDIIGLEWEPCHLFYLIDPMPTNGRSAAYERRQSHDRRTQLSCR